MNVDFKGRYIEYSMNNEISNVYPHNCIYEMTCNSCQHKWKTIGKVDEDSVVIFNSICSECNNKTNNRPELKNVIFTSTGSRGIDFSETPHNYTDKSKRSVMCVMTCGVCDAKWQTPGVWYNNFKSLSLYRGVCPRCSNCVGNTSKDITNNI